MKYIITDGKGNYFSTYGFKDQLLASPELARSFDSFDDANKRLFHLVTTDVGLWVSVDPTKWNECNVKELRPKVIKHNFA